MCHTIALGDILRETLLILVFACNKEKQKNSQTYLSPKLFFNTKGRKNLIYFTTMKKKVYFIVRMEPIVKPGQG